jgi:predicted dehydrogenase
MTALRVGIVGNGYATRAFHAPLIRATEGLTFAALASGSPDKARAEWPGVEVAAAPEALFADPSIDLVVIPTPNDTHHPLAAAALAAGKHVVVDKPFTVTTAEARDLIGRAEAAGRLLSVFHNRRWDGDFLTLRRVLARGELGRIVHFESHFDRYRPQVVDRWRETAPQGGGLWFDLGPHLLDQALTLFGKPDSLWVDRMRQRDGAVNDDGFHAVLRYGPMRAILHAATLVPATGPRFVVHGTRGSFVSHGLDRQEPLMKGGILPGAPGWAPQGEPARLTVWEGETARERALPLEPGSYVSYYAGVRDAIRSGAANPVPPQDALAVMELIEAGLGQGDPA